jgi:hypothetical protein
MTNKEKFKFYKVHESVAHRTFEIGDEYGILEINENSIQERFDMTGYYYIDDDGEKATTDEEYWKIEEIKKKKLYSQDDDVEIMWDSAYVDLIFEYWDGHNWCRIFLNPLESYYDVEEVTDEVGKLKLIAKNEGQTFNEYAYINDKGKYYYKYSSFYVGTLDFLEESDIETLKGMFEDLE